jgi:gamma-glutamyltranspeptidase/glutathione hydrolase
MRSLLLALLLFVPQDNWRASGTQGAVAAGGQGSVDAGIEILKSGGNAIDAAVATILALSVTDHDQFCFGSEVPILVYDAKRGKVEAISGMGAAPRLATFEYFEKRGRIPLRGLEPAAVPAALDACLVALARYGTKSFAEVAAPMILLLDAGTASWEADLAATVRQLVHAEKTAEGDREKRLRAVADYFYRGPVARDIGAWCAENGGLLRAEDFAAHVTRVEEPVSVDYRGHTVYKCGAWTQGPALLEILRLLQGFDLRSMGHNSADAIHLQIEALKLAFADRDVYYADPLFEDVPLKELLSKEYADLRRPLVDPKKASQELRPGDPRRGKPLLDAAEIRKGLGGTPHDTTTCVVADRWGNVVAATPSGWSGVLAGKTGVWLGSRLQSFNLWKGTPNCIAPGKRPRITLTPTLVLKDGKPVLAVSVAGGDGQDQVTLQVVTNTIDFGFAPDRAVTAPRFLTNHFVGSFGQPPPRLGSLTLQREIDDAVADELRKRGHHVTSAGAPFWHPVAIGLDPKTGEFRAAGDPKARRHAAAY